MSLRDVARINELEQKVGGLEQRLAKLAEGEWVGLRELETRVAALEAAKGKKG